MSNPTVVIRYNTQLDASGLFNSSQRLLMYKVIFSPTSPVVT